MQKIEHFGPEFKEIAIGDVVNIAIDKPLLLDCGEEISDFPIAYQTYGTLNEDKSNAVLVTHGLTGDQYVLGEHPVTGKAGWWVNIVGGDKPINTDKLFVICINVLGGCLGSFGPKHINPKTKKPYNLDFPVITIADMVRAQRLLIEHLGITKLLAVAGGSMGGMLALEWASSHSDAVHAVVPIAASSRHTAQNIAFHEIGRQAIIADPDWQDGNYLLKKTYPKKGLAVSRMTAHVTYLSQSALARKFGRELQDRDAVSYGFEADFQVESYLRYQGMTFIERFDPNSYLYITRAMDYFDLAKQHGTLAKAFENTDTAFCIISFSSDWLFPPTEGKMIAQAAASNGLDVSFLEIETDKGHDAFLLDEPELFRAIEGFMNKIIGEVIDA